MSEIYKSFDEWYSRERRNAFERMNMREADNYLRHYNYFKHSWEARQPEIDQLRKELTKKDDEIKRLEKEMGDFGTIGYMSAASDAKEALRKKDEVIEEMREALEFYADPETYFAIGFFPDKPCGDFIEDFYDTEILGYKPGKRARDCLNKLSIGKNEG